MKHILSSALFIVMLNISVQAQNIGRETVKINSVLLPLRGLPDTTETFFVSLKKTTTSLGNTFLSESQENSLNLNGYYRLTTRDEPDIFIEVSLTKELQYLGVKLYVSDHVYKKDKNSPEIPYSAYTYSVSYSSPLISYLISTGNKTVLKQGVAGEKDGSFTYGNTSYNDHFSSENQLQYSWSQAQKYKLAEWERDLFVSSFSTIPPILNGYCMTDNWMNSFTVKYVKEKKTNLYDDLKQAKDLMLQAMPFIETDRVEKINKLIQPDYQKRTDTINKAIAIWEKALLESDLKDSKARIDAKVTRHIYYNLSLAYTLIGNYDKAQQYIQGREDDETNKTLFKNLFAGMQSLSGYIDECKKRQASNSWRPFRSSNDNAYVYIDAEARRKKLDELANAERQKKMAADALLKKPQKALVTSKTGGPAKGKTPPKQK